MKQTLKEAALLLLMACYFIPAMVLIFGYLAQQ
jgi:hypothetical protein